MFYCEPCGSERGWPTPAWLHSYGRCEVCSETADCFETHSSRLPPPSPDPKEVEAAIESIKQTIAERTKNPEEGPCASR